MTAKEAWEYVIELSARYPSAFHYDDNNGAALQPAATITYVSTSADEEEDPTGTID
jgi:hypothetical protein